jgi:uncharacterized protein
MGPEFVPGAKLKAPRYLFERMVKLGREISTIIVEEYGNQELMRRLSDPIGFRR